MAKSELDILKRALERERLARKSAEKILENKSRELYQLSNELKNANEQLETLLDDKSSELKGVYEQINDAYIVMDLDGNVLKMNKIAVDIFGYDIEIEKFNVTNVIVEGEEFHANRVLKQLIQEGTYSNFETRVKAKTGEIKWVQINAILIEEKGIPAAAKGIIRDVTSEKKSKQLLKDSQTRLGNIIANLELAMLIEDEDGRIMLTNNAFCKLFDLEISPNELIGLSAVSLFEKVKESFTNPLDELNRMKELMESIEPYLGEEIHFKNSAIYLRDYIPIFIDYNFNGRLWTFQDVTLSKRYQISVEHERTKYSNIITNMNLGLVEVDNDDVILMANQSFCDISGYNKAELIGRKGMETFLDDKEKQKIFSTNKNRQKGQSNSYELVVRNKSGERKYWLVSGAPNYNLKGEVTGSIGIHLDITEIKNLEAQKEVILKQLEQSNQELHEYAHIVSHDLKSPLRSIDALVNWIKEDNAEKFDARTIENLEHIENTLETMEMLISDVLLYSKVGVNKHRNRRINLNDELKKLIGALYIPEYIEITLPNPLPVIKANKIEMQQLFQNLISNAVKFIDKDKGRIEIGFTETPEFYQFHVTDNGMGIEKQYHEKIFQIFRSLKKSKESTGIGLSIVKKIVDNYQGQIWLESEPGLGTTFYFTIKKF